GTPGHHLTCSITSYSPAPTQFAKGDRVKIACANHVLVAIADVPARHASGSNDNDVTTTQGTTGTTTNGTTTNANGTNANGPITALSATSISVQTMTCSIGTSSPSTDGFHVGDPVRMYCVNGVLYKLAHNEDDSTTSTTTRPSTTQQTTTQPTTTTQ